MTAAEPEPEDAPAPTPAEAAAEPQEERRLGTPFLVLQFFLFPMAIVAVCVGVFLIFGFIAHEGKGARDYLNEIRRGGASLLDLNRRWQAAYELSQALQAGNDPALKDPRFVDEVLAVFEGAKADDPRVRRYLAVALGRLRDPRAVPALLEAARGPGQGAPEDRDTQFYSVVSLGTIGDPAALPDLIALGRSGEPGLRKAVAHALGSLPSDESRAALLALAQDGVEDVRWNAALALARRGDPGAAPVLLAMMDRAHMMSVPGLGDAEREDATLEAVRVAPAVPDPALPAALRKLRESDPSLKVREAAARALEQKPR
jgi:HEAT repeat protein